MSKQPGEIPDGFARFWRLYPKRVAKLEALKAWNAMKPSAELIKDIEDALAWQVRQPSWLKDGGQFIPYPASWLRAGRWMDEPAATLKHQSTAEYLDECPHSPRCMGRNACRVLRDIAAMKAEEV